MRYSITLSYAGAGFCGWQRQPSDPSVQECLEDALGKLLGGEVPVIGAGRTDTGVNAIGYVACFDGPEGLAADDFCYKLNAILPRSIVVSRVAPAAPDFHARFDARRREYTYFLHRVKDPFVEAFSWQCGYPDLDFSAMNTAAALLVGTHDFSCFEKLGADNKTSVCTVFEAFGSRMCRHMWRSAAAQGSRPRRAKGPSVSRKGTPVRALPGRMTPSPCPGLPQMATWDGVYGCQKASDTVQTEVLLSAPTFSKQLKSCVPTSNAAARFMASKSNSG